MEKTPGGPQPDGLNTPKDHRHLQRRPLDNMQQAQKDVDQWIGQFQEGYWHPLTLLARLTEEVGELAREVNHRFGQKPKRQDEDERNLEEEMGDIIFVLCCLANVT